jgi:hypothetical protein
MTVEWAGKDGFVRKDVGEVEADSFEEFEEVVESVGEGG